MSSEGVGTSLLVIGGAKAGKTHYAGQLLRRLEAKKYPLKIAIAPGDRTPLQEVLEKLAMGRSASHTPNNLYKESVWDIGIEGSNRQSQLVWPDYGGEQIEDVVRKRQVTEPWIQRVRDAAGWLFFVRPHLVSLPDDILSRPRHKDHMQSAAQKPAAAEGAALKQPESPATSAGPPQASVAQTPALRTEAALVELLQALLFVKQVGRNARLSWPALVLVLSCWDEIPSAQVEGKWTDPTRFLMDRLPLLGQFIASNWEPNRFAVFGLSSLGKALQDDVDDDAFVDSGPERQGWCVTEGGIQRDDLTIPIFSLLKLMGNGG